MPRLLRLLPGLILAWAASSERAEGQPASAVDSLSFSTSLELSLRAAPELERFALDLQIAAARVAQAGRGPNPELTLEFEDISGVYPGLDEMNLTLSLEQRLERGGKPDARRAVAAARRPLAEFERLVFENDLAREVRVRFLSGQVAQARLALTRESRGRAVEFKDIVRLKVLAGGTSPVEQTRAELHLRQTELEVTQSARALDLARRQLTRLMGDLAPRFEGFAGALDTLSEAGAFADSLALIRNSPSVAWLEAEVDLRQANLALARSEGVSDLAIGFGMRHAGAVDGVTLVGHLSLALPLRDRNKAGIHAATLERSRLTSELAGLTRRVQRELRDLDSQIASAQLGVRTIRREILPLTDTAYHGLLESYRQGRTTYLDVFEARRQFAEARSEELALLLELHTLEAERLRLLGGFRGSAVSR